MCLSSKGHFTAHHEIFLLLRIRAVRCGTGVQGLRLCRRVTAAFSRGGNKLVGIITLSTFDLQEQMLKREGPHMPRVHLRMTEKLHGLTGCVTRRHLVTSVTLRTAYSPVLPGLSSHGNDSSGGARGRFLCRSRPCSLSLSLSSRRGWLCSFGHPLPALCQPATAQPAPVTVKAERGRGAAQHSNTRKR